jgi:probable rRNA maturation factor
MIRVDSALGHLPFDLDLIEHAARQVLESRAASGDLTVVLSDDAHLRDLNARYLGIDAPTDVLSFPSGQTDPETGQAYLGDVIISVPQAQVQAHAAGHPLAAEVQLLVVHGVLHLLGLDHAQPADKAGMWAAQSQILARLGLSEIAMPE